MTCKTLFAVLISLIGFAPLAAQDNGAPARETVGEVSANAIPREFEAFLACKFGSPETLQVGDREAYFFAAETGSLCGYELREAIAEVEAAQRGEDPRRATATAALFASHVEKLQTPVLVTYFEVNELPKSFTVPDGMWEYHLCKAGHEVILNGKIAQPKFPEDKDCDLSRAYSSRLALEFLQKAGQPETVEEQKALVESYIAEIDRRSEKSVSGK